MTLQNVKLQEIKYLSAHPLPITEIFQLPCLCLVCGQRRFLKFEQEIEALNLVKGMSCSDLCDPRKENTG